tara:strand:+ start:425 stop:1501 length:1077 start_codon:yes stop_codon:yes gene_type:complete
MYKLQKYVDYKKKENIETLQHETQKSKNDMLHFIKDNNIVLFGRSALELYLGLELTLPVYTIFNKSLQLYKNFFNKLNRKYKYAYKIQPLLHKKTYYIEFRMVKYMYIYKINMDKYIVEQDGYKYVLPVIGLIDIYYMYSTPLYNSNFYVDLAKIEQTLMKKLFNKNIKIKDKDLNNINKYEKDVYTLFLKIVKPKYLDNNPHILISGILAMNDIIDTDYIDSIDIIVSYNQLQTEFQKLTTVVKNLVMEKTTNKFQYFNDIYKVFLGKVHVLTYYITDVPFCYYKEKQRCNYHTVLFILLYKYLMTTNKRYLDFINILLNKGSKVNVLNDNNFTCFQNVFVDDIISDMLLIKNKLIK